MSAPVRLRRRPLLVDAYRYDGDNALDVVRWITANSGQARFVGGELVVETFDGWHDVPVGHFVLREVDPDREGFHYPVRPSIVAATYDEVGE